MGQTYHSPRLEHVQDSSNARVSVTHHAEDNGLLTKGANVDNTSRTLCPYGFTHIDDPLQLGLRNSRVLEYIRHSRKVQRMKAQLIKQVKLAREYVKSENM